MRNTISIIGIALAVALLGVAAQKRPPNYNPAKMPDTDFDCSDKIIGGYYGDAETECQMFHVCVKVPGIGVQDFRFLCPNDTAFDQENQVCDDWYNIDCAGQVSSPRAPGSRPSPTPIALGPSTTRPAVQQAAQGPNAVPQGLPPAPRTKPIASNHAGEEDDDFFLQRADSGDRRLHHGTSRDLFKGSQSGNFFNSKNGGKDDDDDYEPDYRPNAFRHSQKAKNPGPLPPFVQQYQQQHGLQQQRPVNQQQANSNNNNFRQQTTQAPRQNFPTTQPPRQNFPTTQPPRQNFPTTLPPRQNFPQQQQQQNFPQQQPDAFAQQNNQQRKKKVTVRRKLVQKGDQDQEQNLQQKQQFQQQQQQQQPFQQQPRRYEEDEEYFRTYTIDQHSNVDSPNQAFGQRGNFPAIRTTIAPITHGSTVPSQTQGFPSGAPTTAYTAAAGTGAPTTVLDAARNHNYQTKARYNTIQRSRGELPTTATEYFTSPSTPPPTTTTQQKQYSLFYAKQQQQQQQQTTSPTTPQPFQQRGSSPAAAATTANNNRFNYNTYKLTNNGATTADDYEHPEEQEFLKTAHSNNYRASDFNSFNRATTYNKDSGSNAYNTKASTSAAANQTTAATKPSSAFPVYFPTSPRPAPFSPAQTTPPPQRQATSSSSAGTTQQQQQQQQQQTSAGFNNNNNFYSPQNAPRPFSPSPAPQSYSPTSAPSTVAAFNNQFNSRASSPSRGPPATAATTVAPQPPPKKYTAKVVPSQQASPTAAAPLKSTKAAAVAPKNDYDYAYYDDSDAGAYEYGLDPISDSHFAKTRTDSVKIKKDQ